MKKLIMAVAIVCTAVAANAAAVGWSTTGLADYKNDKYLFFVIGQNGASSVATITALLDAGTAVDSYSFGGGAVNAGGVAMQASSTSGKSLGEGTYTGFFVLFNSASPVAGSTKYSVLQGASGLTQVIGAQTAGVTFAGLSGTAIMGEWKTYGASAAPEPTSGVLLLLGVAGLALKRRRA